VRLPQLLKQRNVKLVVIDSTAGLFRSEYDPGDAVNRAKDLQMVGGQLHKIAEQFRLAVICVNQVPFYHKYLAVFTIHGVKFLKHWYGKYGVGKIVNAS
jgi:RecA/RadA recombinase